MRDDDAEHGVGGSLATTSTSRRSWTTGARGGSTTTPRRPRCSTAPASARGCWSRRGSTPPSSGTRCTARAMLAGVRGLGLEVFGDVAHKMHNVVAVEIPDGVDGDAARAATARRTSASRSARRSVRCTARSGGSARWATTPAQDAVLTTLAALEQVLRATAHRSPPVAASAPPRRCTRMTTAERGPRPVRRAGPLHRARRRGSSGSTSPASTPAPTRVAAAGWSRPGCAPGRTPPATSAAAARARRPGLPALLLGSHLDTVPDAGSYDGMLGVVMAIAVAERLRRPDRRLPVRARGGRLQRRGGHPLRQGAARQPGRRRAPGTRTGGTCATGTASRCTRRSCEFGLDPRRVGEAARRPEELVGYLEAHIEQGPYLEAADALPRLRHHDRRRAPVPAQRRRRGPARGRHAVPPPARRAGRRQRGDHRDRAAAPARPSCIATVGRIEVQPGAVNVIPGRADFSLDLRAATDAERDAMWDVAARRDRAGCARSRGLRFEVRRDAHRRPRCRARRGCSDAVVGGHPQRPATTTRWGCGAGPGHDAMAIGAVTDIGMLFVRCHDGISHHPDGGRARARRRRGAGCARGRGPRRGGPARGRDEPMRIDERITERYAVLSPQERRAAETLLEHLDDLATYRSAELADLAGVSKATMSRLFRSLGLRRTSTRCATTCAPCGPPASRAASTARATPRRPTSPTSRSRCGTPSTSPVLATSSRCWSGARRVWSSAGATATRWPCTCASSSPTRAATSRLAPLPGQVIGEELADLGAGDAVVVVGFRRRPGRLRGVPGGGRAAPARRSCCSPTRRRVLHAARRGVLARVPGREHPRLRQLRRRDEPGQRARRRRADSTLGRPARDRIDEIQRVVRPIEPRSSDGPRHRRQPPAGPRRATTSRSRPARRCWPAAPGSSPSRSRRSAGWST